MEQPTPIVSQADVERIVHRDFPLDKYADIISELDAKLQIPGVRNGWTQPIINRINMLSTGVRTDLGVKIFGKDLDTLERLAIEA